MSSKFKVQSSKFRITNSKLKIQNWLFIFCSFNFAFLIFSGCSVPNLESDDCTEARNTVKELYSYHFGNEMKSTKANLKLREKYLSIELKQQLEMQPESAVDYFTATDDYPKAFRLGECKIVETDKKVNIQIVLFWKTDTRTEQKEVQVEVIKQGNTWLVNRVESK